MVHTSTPELERIVEEAHARKLKSETTSAKISYSSHLNEEKALRGQSHVDSIVNTFAKDNDVESFGSLDKDLGLDTMVVGLLYLFNLKQSTIRMRNTALANYSILMKKIISIPFRLCDCDLGNLFIRIFLILQK